MNYSHVQGVNKRAKAVKCVNSYDPSTGEL
jgi:hypothetical protein